MGHNVVRAPRPPSRYEVHGEGARLIVYLHGLLLDADLNRGIAHALAEPGNRVVLLDLLGHGRSDKPAHASEYRIDLYVEQVFALLNELGAPEAVLGGLSLGANVSLLAAAESPERVRGLVLEMPVLKRAAPSVALTFVPVLLALHHASAPARLLTGLVRRVPRTHFRPLDRILGAASLDPDQMARPPRRPARSGGADRRAARGHRRAGAGARPRADLIRPFSDAANLSRQLPNAQLVHARSPFEMRLRPERLTAEIATSRVSTLRDRGPFDPGTPAPAGSE